MKNTLRNLIVTSLFVTSLCAQALVIPQVADGGGWASTVVLTNTTGSDTTASLTFYQVAAGGVPQSWTPPLDIPSTEGLAIPAGSSLFLHSSGIAAALTQGWAQLIGPGVVGYVVYTYTSGTTGQYTSQGTAPAVTGSTRILVPFDNTGSHATQLAVVNPNAGQVTVSVKLNADGAVSTGGLLTLSGEGQMTFAMAKQFPATVGTSGLAEFYTGTGNFAIIALQANTSLSGVFSFTSAPTYSETGPSIIATSTGAVPAGDIAFGGFSDGRITSSASIRNIGGQFGVYKPAYAWITRVPVPVAPLP
jgi:hypothetical protein